MLPCQSACPHYQEGCHKTCGQWSRFLEEQRACRLAKKRYLPEHRERVSTILRQYRAVGVSYPVR